MKQQPNRFKDVSGSRLRAGSSKSSVSKVSARSVRGSSSNARGYGYRWQKARAAFLADNPLCVMCSQPDRPVAATVVDHIKPHKGNDALFWDESNWQALCSRCHSSTKQRIERKQG